jgi:hypothetical protein
MRILNRFAPAEAAWLASSLPAACGRSSLVWWRHDGGCAAVR